MFQPATKAEVACIVHFHLHNPIMVSAPVLMHGRSESQRSAPLLRGMRSQHAALQQASCSSMFMSSCTGYSRICKVVTVLT